MKRRIRGESTGEMLEVTNGKFGSDDSWSPCRRLNPFFLGSNPCIFNCRSPAKGVSKVESFLSFSKSLHVQLSKSLSKAAEGWIYSSCPHSCISYFQSSQTSPLPLILQTWFLQLVAWVFIFILIEYEMLLHQNKVWHHQSSTLKIIVMVLSV